MANIWEGLLSLLQGSLQFFHGIAQGVGLSSGLSYGIAIILLTLAVRIILLPLTIKQTKSMLDMQRLQPKLKALQEKYKDDKEKLQQEMMKLYQEHKVNPFGGCLPMLLQMPLIIALYRVVVDFAPLKNAIAFGLKLGLAPKAALAGGLLAGWPYIVLLLLMAVSSYIPQKMMASDQQQNSMMLMMGGFMLFVGWSFPTGALIYWTTTNIVSIVQQWAITALVSKKGSQSAVVAKDGSKAKKQVEAER